MNVYLLEDSDGWILVDTGLNTKPSLAIVNDVLDRVCSNKPLKAVLLTHAHVDHAGAAGPLCQRWKAPLWMTQLEYQSARYFRLTHDSHAMSPEVDLKRFYRRGGIDSSLADQIAESLDSLFNLYAPLPKLDLELQQFSELVINEKSWRLIISDGHTHAHLSLFSDELGVMIGGDQVLGRISSNVSVRPDDWSGDPIGTWIEALSRLRSLPDNTLILPAHEQPFYGLKARLDELIAGYKENAKKLLVYSYTSKTAEELMRELYPRELSPFEVHLAYGETVAYVNYLLSDGRLAVKNLGNEIPMYQRTEV